VHTHASSTALYVMNWSNFLRRDHEGNVVGRFAQLGARATAVGKAILANYPDEEVIALLGRTGMQRHTDRTLVTPEAFLKELAEVRRLGYAVDEGEQEIGVRCVGVAVPETPQPMALSSDQRAGAAMASPTTTAALVSTCSEP